ncbi:PREDICTED: golgin candidate 3-like [Lupinus angustifolius]|uniref:golgin candidate 3-like n=1 Tax=Lupinus angustifolius TaxID=3871 RepID=UPI00092E6BF9|nr:PREDICTED: golgin candidate 3-like [Lupinus angustifolius]
MWGTISNLKDNLNKIALDVHDDDVDHEQMLLRIYADHNSAVSDRRNSHGFAHSNSPLANGIDHYEIEQYEAEIKRLQASEAEIKALSLNYAALLKEKEDQIVRLNKENASLKQNMVAEGSVVSTNGTYLVKLADLVDGNNRPTVDVHHTTEIQKVKLELEQERDQLSKTQQKFEEEQKLNKSFQEEFKILKLERDKTYKEVNIVRSELNEKVSEIKRLQLELARRENEEAVEAVDSLKRLTKTLEKENSTLKMEKIEVEAALKSSRKSFTDKMLSGASQIQNNNASRINNMPDPSQNFPGEEEMERSIQKLSKELMETQRDRDKVLQELTRIKQHLLEKESEESEKIDEDGKIIEELRDSNDYLRAQISNLERTLKQAIASQDELKMANSNEILKFREIIDDLNKNLTNCLSTIDAKNIELLNLQTALGQYYAEIEAKEHLEGELARAREETAKLSQLLKDADVSKSEKEGILVKLSQSEKAQSEWRSRVSKLEEDNAKLSRAVEQSMTRLNRMSVDSDYLVDRRIVIKLLVTYFQRNHSREVLDLMVRMLGFSDEDKQRIGGAQQGAGKGVVRGVLGLPSRLVGGMLGGSSTEAAANTGSDNQSFADLWVDFLLKETEEREKRESTANTGKSTEDSHDESPRITSASPPFSKQPFRNGAATAFPTTSTNQNTSPPLGSHFRHSGHFDSEFSTVPLTSSDGKATGSDLFQRY